MNEREWAGEAKRMLQAWPNATLDVSTLGHYFDELKQFPVEYVRAALASLSREGREFIPTSGQVFRRVVEMEVDAPPFAEVLGVCRKAVRSGLGGNYDKPAFKTRNQIDPIDRALQGCHPLIPAFIDHLGRRQVAITVTGEHSESRLRKLWDEFVADTTEQRLLNGIKAAGLRRVERANGLRPMSEVLAGYLPAGKDEAA